MSPLALELCDRALALASEGRVLACAPSTVFDGSGSEPAGAAAWHALHLRPTEISTRHWRELGAAGAFAARAAALVAAELRARLAGRGAGERGLWIAAPAALSPRDLETLLGIAEQLSLPVHGCVDAAVASASALGLDAPALVVELGLHDAHVTALEVAGEVRRRDALGSSGGLCELYQQWSALLGVASVRRTRFDPLHDAATEQRLLEALPALGAAAAARGEALAVLEHEGRRFEVALTRDQLAAAGRPVYGAIVRLLRALRPAGAPITLIVPRLALDLPGLPEALAEFGDCELIAIEDGFAAAALSALEPPQRLDGEPVRLLRRLPPAQRAQTSPLAARRLLKRPPARAPTHVLFGAATYPLAAEPLGIGRAPAHARALVLPEGLAGVSRAHCALIVEGGEAVLVDHSRFGTFVNGERVRERTRVVSGDRIRIGEPGVELVLIAVGSAGERHAATA
ncbi:MAG TPA: FHA domain-containing protein [Steroidobacteraceae bacterium]|nr:FHA domain-containing protein [Steroidobacteraceae bacterium]